LITNIITALSNNSFYKDYYLHLKMYNIDYNHRDTINIQAILKYIEKKYTNLIKKKK